MMAAHVDRLLKKLGTGSSIRSRLRFSFIVLMALLILPALVSVVMMTQYAQRYHALIQQVERVAALKPLVQSTIPGELWEVVAGNKAFDEGAQYKAVAQVNRELESLMDWAQGSFKELNVARRTMDTLSDYIDAMREQYAQGLPVAAQEETLEEIRSVAALIGDMLEKYVDVEITAAGETSNQLQRMLEGVLALICLLVAVTFIFSIIAQRSLARAIQEPIGELEKFAFAIAGGDFDARAPQTPVGELQALTSSFNTMGMKLEKLIAENRSEQENLKKSELRALQAQIAPHFLYNTLDAIVWLAEADRSDEVIHITRALSDFFRISLSQGKDWIELGEEVKHLTGYLTIQKVRYRDILDYDIDIPEKLYGVVVLKLLLQPLVENAIYHGIKHRRGRGMVTVRGAEQDDLLTLSVRDNGVGMCDERLKEVRLGLLGTDEQTPGYGLFNVNQRIKLYYNQPKGIEIDSDENGTVVSLSVPLRR